MFIAKEIPTQNYQTLYSLFSNKEFVNSTKLENKYVLICGLQTDIFTAKKECKIPTYTVFILEVDFFIKANLHIKFLTI